MVTATASDAAYTWTIDDGSVAEIETSEPRKMTAKAVGAGNATASVRFEDEASDNRAEGSTSFTVEAPEVSLAVPETVTLGQTSRQRQRFPTILEGSRSFGNYCTYGF